MRRREFAAMETIHKPNLSTPGSFRLSSKEDIYEKHSQEPMEAPKMGRNEETLSELQCMF
jgi:hypothetical protein